MFLTNLQIQSDLLTFVLLHLKMSKRKAPENENNLNGDFCDFLTELANFEKNTNRNVHKYNAYRKAATVLASHPIKIKSGEEAKKLEGIGDKIAKKIDEFLATGKLKKLEKIREDITNKAINLFTGISGIGPAKARELVDCGILTLDDLRQHKYKLTHHQQIGLKYMIDFDLKIPRPEIEEIEKIIAEELSNFDEKYRITICGSYRRGKKESGDIDVIVTHDDFTTKTKDRNLKCKYLRDVIEVLRNNGLVTETISLGESKFMGACKLNGPTRRLDIRLIPKDQYYCGILYFTGSDQFNKAMRTHALEQKYTLNEYSLRPFGATGIPGEPVPVTCEKDIFEYIDYPYKAPEERDF